MMIRLERATVVQLPPDGMAQIVERGAVVDVAEHVAQTLVALGRAQIVAAAAPETAERAPQGETADVRPVARTRRG